MPKFDADKNTEDILLTTLVWLFYQ